MFYVTKWDPALIILQILTLQSSFYLLLGAHLFGLDLLWGLEFTLAQMFDFRDLGFSNTPQLITLISFVSSSLLASVSGLSLPLPFVPTNTGKQKGRSS